MPPDIAGRPAKLKITPQGQDPIEVQFNPTSYSITKPVTYTPSPRSDLNVPLLTFAGGGGRTLTLNLFFDVTEPTADGNKVKDVRDLTNKFVALTRIKRDNKKKRPPVCVISWGRDSTANPDFPFSGVVTNLVQEFTLFEKDGTPVRARLTVAFLEFKGWEEGQRESDPEFTTHVVKRGDTLSSIAATAYNDPSRWRLIADTNHLDDPRQLQIGRALNIPKTR
ncbi:MAG TPA: LysM peptidoglycan-binding domain-containing protein [Blastocatellia bacterium]|jgi:hypothetical protein|nr:LysM peptidoglycan-binding domain-containing protein [Blastocatellia bacterium]